MQCVSPWFYEKTKQMLPCGHCVACRIAKSREWYVRLYHESFYHSDSVFLTLTYNEESVPKNMELSKDDFKDFVKRLRGRYDIKLKYYGCGEYGDRTGRPHYHVIIFGTSVEEKNRKNGFVIRGPIKECWNKGYIGCGSVTVDSMRYVTDYIFNKKSGLEADKDGRVQPFNFMSKGLGLRYCLDNEEKLREKLGVKVRGVELGLPRYYVKKLGLEEEVKRLKDGKTVRLPESEVVVRIKDIVKHGAEKAVEREEERKRQRERNINARGRLRSKSL